jgi:hypothetical protein
LKVCIQSQKVTEEHFKNPFIRRHGKDTYSHCVRIKPVKELKYHFVLDLGLIFATYLKERYGDYESYFNHIIKNNSIKRISEYEFSIFNGLIDIRKRWQTSCEQKPLKNRYEEYLLLPIKFSSKWEVDTKAKGNDVFEYHFKRFDLLPHFTSYFVKWRRIGIILYGYDNGKLRFYGHAYLIRNKYDPIFARKVEPNKERNEARTTERIVEIEGYRKFNSLQPSVEVEKVIQSSGRYWMTDLNKSLNERPIQSTDEELFCFLINNDEEHSENIQQLKNSIVYSSKGSNDQLISAEEIFTAEGTALRTTRRGQDAIREAALEIYSYQCALCDVKDPNMLQASHIVGWSIDVKKTGNTKECNLSVCNPS